jgi:hypothetical protein
MNVRSSAVAGAFYPLTKAEVEDQLSELFGYWDIDIDNLADRPRKDSSAVVVPHAGWPYSGYVAARVFADIPKVERVVLMGPNHYGIGPDFSVSSDDAWETPLGEVGIDGRMAEWLNGPAELDEMAHLREHSIEVQLPFLQKALDDFKIVPISIKHYAPDEKFLHACQDFGKSIAEAISKSGKKTLVVASTDFTHYEPQETAEEKDSEAMGAIEKLDEAELFRTISEMKISMCGYAGVAAAITASKAMGAEKGEKIEYMTTGDTTGNRAQVVGYGGLRIL